MPRTALLVERILVIGAGTMGAGIAAVAAQAGYGVDIVEPDAATRERARGKVGTDALAWYADIPMSTTARLAIEAVPERLDLKRDVMRRLEAVLPGDAVLATNTSSLAVEAIAEGLQHPERVVGLHFFNPPLKMQLVEIVAAERTSDAVLEAARTFVERIGKTAVMAADTPGFIVNRVARPFYLQAMRAYEAGVAPIDDLDRLARGAGFRMGPFELMDLIGLDVNLATTESIYERTRLDRLAPVAVQRQLVAQGRLGRKTGGGFYDEPPRHDEQPPQAMGGTTQGERIAIVGYGQLALDLNERLSQRFANVTLVEAEDAFDDLPLDATVVFDASGGAEDRTAFLSRCGELYDSATAIFFDAYATSAADAARRVRAPERLVGYGILGDLASQRIVEIVDAQATGDDALELAQEFFEAAGCEVTLVEDAPGLFLGRTVGSIVNEAVAAVEEGVASPEDVDLAMTLGTNYPRGPIAWGRAIGGARVGRILQQLAKHEGAAFAPHRALWVLDAAGEEDDAGVLDVRQDGASYDG